MRAALVITLVAVVAGCDAGPLPCAQTCDGCCNAETCLKGTNVSACGSSGAKCSDCFAAKLVCTVDRVCERAPSSGCAACSGCCEGGTCLAGNNDFKCGTGGQKCIDCRANGLFCSTGQGCGSSGVGGGGGGGGGGGASGGAGGGSTDLFVTVRYDYQTCPAGCGDCTLRYCTTTKMMSQALWDYFRPDFGGCTVATQVGGYAVNCTPNCSPITIACGMSVYADKYNCTTPQRMSSTDCSWK